MKLHHVMWKELWHRKLGALVLLVGVALCVGLIVAVQRISIASADEVRKAMLEMGKNIVILPKAVSLDQYWAGEFGDNTLPQTDVGIVANLKLAGGGQLLARHYLGSLQRRVQLQDRDGEPRDVILCGIAVEIDLGVPEAIRRDAQRPLESGECELGYHVAQRLGYAPGDFLFLGKPPGGKRLKVVKVREETGTVNDFKVFVDLPVAQDFLLADRPPKERKVVNVIEAVSCMCAPQMLPVLAKQLEQRLTDSKTGETKVRAYHFMAIATARFKARELAARAADIQSFAAFLVAAIIIGGYSVLNARERRREIGILLAIAARPRHVTLLILEKMLLLGLVGGLIGTALGDFLVTKYGPPVAAALRPALWQMYGLALGLAVVLAVIPSLVGVVLASRTDPADTLREL